MRKIALFNHKGGVGKTTLTINLADAFASQGKRVLVVDADPQCNLSAFFVPEQELDTLLGASRLDEGQSEELEHDGRAADADLEEDGGSTLWTGIRPVVKGRGEIETIEPYEVRSNLWLAVGDVLLSLYEEELPAAWTDSFARKSRGYDVISALPRLVNSMAEACDADVVLYDVGPNVGPLNRTIILDSDYFVTPVAPDLFSLRALTTVGQAISRWVKDWETVRSIAPGAEKERLSRGKPTFLGYIVSAFKVVGGGGAAEAHNAWERRIAPRVSKRVVGELAAHDLSLVCPTPYKLGAVKHFQSLAAQAQEKRLPFAQLRGHVNSGNNPEIAGAQTLFNNLASQMLRRMDTHDNS